MNKTELIEAIATRSNTTKAQTTAMLNELLEVIQQTIASGNDVQLVGFGTFSVTERAGREGRNPATGETITIPAKKVVKFKPGKAYLMLRPLLRKPTAAKSAKPKQTEKKK
jgi:DNA-binding protein HU-beta